MKRTYLATSAILIGAMIVCAGCEDAPAASTGDSASGVVATKSGQLRGAVGDGIASFKGIPDGASTAGSGRFKPPQKVQPERDWRGRCHGFGPICPQRGVVATGADEIIGEGGTENTGLGSIPRAAPERGLPGAQRVDTRPRPERPPTGDGVAPRPWLGAGRRSSSTCTTGPRWRSAATSSSSRSTTG